jgi:hypothetical protein
MSETSGLIRFTATLILALLVLGLVPAAAQSATDQPPPPVTVGGVLFYDYTFTLAPDAEDAGGQTYRPNGFNVTRAYLNVTGRVAPFLRFRITPDITRMSGSGGSTDGSVMFRMKYGYAQFDLDQVTGAWDDTWVRMGIHQTPFIDAADGVYRYRFQGTSFAERDGGLSSADAGVSARTAFPGGYGDVHIGVYNGEGYSRAEQNEQKALMLRATLRPMPDGGALTRGLRVTGYLHRDHVMAGAERHRYIGSIWYEHQRFNAGFDYLSRDDRSAPDARLIESDGLSVFVTPFLQQKGDGLELLLRYDTFRPDRSIDARRHRTIAGLAWWMPTADGRTAALMLDYEQVRYRGAAETRPADRRLILHGLVTF